MINLFRIIIQFTVYYFHLRLNKTFQKLSFLQYCKLKYKINKQLYNFFEFIN